jgi:CheY-like chemotaxis protein
VTGLEPNGTILLVEDNDDDAFFFNRAVKRSGLPISVDRVTDGPEALDYLMRQIPSAENVLTVKPGIILLDLKLPKLNGFEVLTWIRAHQRLKHLFVSILSSSSEDSDRLRASYLKADAYLVKPSSIQEYDLLVNRIYHDWLTRGKGRPADSAPKAETPKAAKARASIENV